MAHVTIEKTNLGTKSAPAAVQVTNLAATTLLIAANPKRISVSFFNNGPNAIYLGRDNTVTTATGYPIPVAGSFLDTESQDAWYAIAATAAQVTPADTRVVEVSGV